MQSGISRVAPPEPESGLHSLPPILRNTCQVPIPRCSKGPRGLSVLPRVTSIFTRSAISPSPQLRQCPSRYAIRAGRNLPDKEFRSSASPRRRGGRTISSTLTSMRVGWRMASEDSRNRDMPFAWLLISGLASTKPTTHCSIPGLSC